MFVDDDDDDSFSGTTGAKIVARSLVLLRVTDKILLLSIVTNANTNRTANTHNRRVVGRRRGAAISLRLSRSFRALLILCKLMLNKVSTVRAGSICSTVLINNTEQQQRGACRFVPFRSVSDQIGSYYPYAMLLPMIID